MHSTQKGMTEWGCGQISCLLAMCYFILNPCADDNIIPDAEAWWAAVSLPDEARKEISNLAPNYSVAPTQDVPIVRSNGETGDRELVFVHWGLIPFWAKDKSIRNRMINARAETVAEKPTNSVRS